MSTSAPGRRAASGPVRASRVTLVAAGVIPLLSVAALATIQPWRPTVADAPPSQAVLDRWDVGCPAAPRGGGPVLVTTADGAAEGRVTIHVSGEGRDEAAEVVVRESQPAEVTQSAALVVNARDALAEGLVAARLGGPRPAVAPCRPPAPDQWFTGLGARPEHASVVELTNPDGGPAVADVWLWGAGGAIEADGLRGIRVPGRSTTTLDLSELTPARGELSGRVQVSRGRLAVAVTDQVGELGGPISADWLPPQPEPVTSGLALGLAAGEGERVLVIANPGEDEARVRLQVVTESSSFSPAGVEEIRVPPQTTRQVSLTGALPADAVSDALGVAVEATRPVTATVRTVTAGDVSHATLVGMLDSEAAAILPGGEQVLVLAGADRTGVAEVVTRSADGVRLDTAKVELEPGRGHLLKLPAKARVVVVRLSRTSVTAVVRVDREGVGAGTAVIALAPVVRSDLVPQVRPVQP